MAYPTDRELAPLGLFRVWLALGLMLCAGFLYGCLMHNPPGEPGIPYFDKIQHASAFVVMGAWFGSIFWPRYARVLIALSAFGASTEILQWFSGYRDGDPFDWMADTTGVAIGLGFAWLGAKNWLRYIDERVTAAANRT